MIVLKLKKLDKQIKTKLKIKSKSKYFKTNTFQQEILFKFNLFVLQQTKNKQKNENTKIDLVFSFFFSYSNVFITINGIDNKLIYKVSHGQLENQGFDPVIKESILQYLNNITGKLNKKYNIAIHYYGLIKSYYNKIIVNYLKKKYSIKIIKNYNIIPQNGCRKKKKKRK